MKKIALILIVLCFFGCESSETIIDNNILIGNFKEMTPIENRAQVSMTGQSLTYILTETGSGTSFSIKELSNNRLELSCNECDETAPRIVTYNIIDVDTFEIGGFFFETNNQIMTFERLEAE